jgi:plasmid maintenance system antidote protein VapI
VDLDLATLLEQRGLTKEMGAVLGRVAPSTITRICHGQVRAAPKTVIALAKALGVSATRMQRMCDAHYYSAHPGEALGPREAAPV